VVLDGMQRVQSMTGEAAYWLSELGAVGELPVAVRAVAARVQLDRSTVRLKVRTPAGEWLELQASRLGEDGQLAVVIGPVAPAELGSLLLDLHGLTPAQQRVTELLLRGYSTRQIVDRLCLSPHTVQEHVRASFDKVGVGSRRELVSVLLRGSASRG
jgi:DNA-binding CsgD family transcriptional regulator